MLKLTLLAVVLLSFGFTEVNAQKCPRTDRTLMILVLNGTEALNVRYKIFPILPRNIAGDNDRVLEYIYKTFQYSGSTASIIANGYSAKKALPEIAEVILKKYRTEDYVPWANSPENELSGSIKGGKVVFAASDSVRQLFLMKVTSDNYSAEYLIGNFFGGCSVVDKIELTEYRSWP